MKLYRLKNFPKPDSELKLTKALLTTLQAQNMLALFICELITNKENLSFPKRHFFIDAVN